MADLETIVLSAVAGTLCSFFLGFFSRRHEQALRIQSENAIRTNEQALRKDVDQAIKLHEAQLRLFLEREIQRARAEVERDLKTHEIRLRVEADLRLKLTDRILNDVGQYRTRMVAAFNAIYLITQEAEPQGATPKVAQLIEDAKRAFAAVPTSVAYIPPELLDSTMTLLGEAHDCFRNVVAWASLPARPDRTARCLETNAQIEAIGERTRQLFGAWQKEQFALLRAGLGQAQLTQGSTEAHSDH